MKDFFVKIEDCFFKPFDGTKVWGAQSLNPDSE